MGRNDQLQGNGLHLNVVDVDHVTLIFRTRIEYKPGKNLLT